MFSMTNISDTTNESNFLSQYMSISVELYQLQLGRGFQEWGRCFSA